MRTSIAVHLFILKFLVELFSLSAVAASTGGFIVAYGINYLLQQERIVRMHPEDLAEADRSIYAG